ncbi:hypothetical protein Hanom_Chr11g01038861 [Helianthus anomalus]
MIMFLTTHFTTTFMELMNKNHTLNLGQDLMNTDDSGYGFFVNEPSFNTDLLDSASSITMVTKWEPEYLTEVLANIETIFVDFTIGKTRKIMNPRVFDWLEFGRPNEEPAKLRRELVFNCVSVWRRGAGCGLKD